MIFSSLTAPDFPLMVVVILMISGFIAGYLDAIAGGGGMIQTMVLLMAGVPPVNTLATNKLAAISGTLMAVAKYTQEKVIDWRLVLFCLFPCCIAATLGTKLVIVLSDYIILWLIIFCIPVALIIILIKPSKRDRDEKSPSIRKAVFLLTPIGFYDGLVGPGTGTYMAIAANRGLNISYLRATGLAKPLNLATNIGSAVIYIFAGKVIWAIAVPMAIASVIGAYFGSRSAIQNGDIFIKNIMLLMLISMLIVNVFKLFL